MSETTRSCGHFLLWESFFGRFCEEPYNRVFLPERFLSPGTQGSLLSVEAKWAKNVQRTFSKRGYTLKPNASQMAAPVTFRRPASLRVTSPSFENTPGPSSLTHLKHTWRHGTQTSLLDHTFTFTIREAFMYVTEPFSSKVARTSCQIVFSGLQRQTSVSRVAPEEVNIWDFVWTSRDFSTCCWSILAPWAMQSLMTSRFPPRTARWRGLLVDLST